MEAAPFFVPLLPILYSVFCPKRTASSFSRYPSCPPAARPEGFLFALPRSGRRAPERGVIRESLPVFVEERAAGAAAPTVGNGRCQKRQGSLSDVCVPGEKHSPGSLPLEGKVVSPSAKPDEVFFPAPQRSRKEAFLDVFPSSVKSFVSLAFVTCLACGGGGPYGGGRLWSARRTDFSSAALLSSMIKLNLMFCTPSIIIFFRRRRRAFSVFLAVLFA